MKTNMRRPKMLNLQSREILESLSLSDEDLETMADLEAIHGYKFDIFERYPLNLRFGERHSYGFAIYYDSSMPTMFSGEIEFLTELKEKLLEKLEISLVKENETRASLKMKSELMGLTE